MVLGGGPSQLLASEQKKGSLSANLLPGSGRQLPIRQTPEHHPGSQSRQQGRAGQEHHGLVMTMTELSRCCFRIFMVIY